MADTDQQEAPQAPQAPAASPAPRDEPAPPAPPAPPGPSLIPQPIDYFYGVAVTGLNPYPWTIVRDFFYKRLDDCMHAMVKWQSERDKIELDMSAGSPLKGSHDYILRKAYEFDKAPPFTWRRICELMSSSLAEYTKADKYFRALERVLGVVGHWGDRCFLVPCEPVQPKSAVAIRNYCRIERFFFEGEFERQKQFPTYFDILMDPNAMGRHENLKFPPQKEKKKKKKHAEGEEHKKKRSGKGKAKSSKHLSASEADEKSASRAPSPLPSQSPGPSSPPYPSLKIRRKPSLQEPPSKGNKNVLHTASQSAPPPPPPAPPKTRPLTPARGSSPRESPSRRKKDLQHPTPQRASPPPPPPPPPPKVRPLTPKREPSPRGTSTKTHKSLQHRTLRQTSTPASSSSPPPPPPPPPPKPRPLTPTQKLLSRESPLERNESPLQSANEPVTKPSPSPPPPPPPPSLLPPPPPPELTPAREPSPRESPTEGNKNPSRSTTQPDPVPAPPLLASAPAPTVLSTSSAPTSSDPGPSAPCPDPHPPLHEKISKRKKKKRHHTNKRGYEPLFEFFTTTEMAERDLRRFGLYVYEAQKCIADSLPLARIVNLYYYLLRSPPTRWNSGIVQKLLQNRLRSVGVDLFPPGWTLTDELPMLQGYQPIRGICPIIGFDVDQDYEDSNFEIEALTANTKVIMRIAENKPGEGGSTMVPEGSNSSPNVPPPSGAADKNPCKGEPSTGSVPRKRPASAKPPGGKRVCGRPTSRKV